MLETFIRQEHKAWDEGTWQEVIRDDCYRIKDREFTAEDVIVDIGANIGLFSGLALERGAGKVISFEASPYTFRQLVVNLHPYRERSTPMNRAVWRSDELPKILHLNAIPDDGNTGGVNVLEDRGTLEVITIGLDVILEAHPKVKLLKIDCEGSEYPILYTVSHLANVEEIIIEVHPVDHLLKPEDNVRPGQNTPNALSRFLSQHGFDVKNEHRDGMDDGWAYLFCRRRSANG